MTERTHVPRLASNILFLAPQDALEVVRVTYSLVHYCTLSMTECRVGTPYMRRNFIDGPPKASVDQSGPSFLQKLHLGYVPGPQKNFGDHSTFF